MSTPDPRIPVPQIVLNGLTAARDDGTYNMFEVNNVIRLLISMDHLEAASWVYNNQKLYVRGIFAGFRAVEAEA